MIAVDMDGTLLGSDGVVSPRNLEAWRAAELAGIEMVVATGRRHCYAMRQLRGLEMRPAAALVSSNGTVVRTIGSMLLARRLMDRETARSLCAHLGEFRDALVITFDNVGESGDDRRGALMVENLARLNESVGKWIAVNEPYIEHVIPIERALEGEEAPIQMMVCGTMERMRRAEQLLLRFPGVAGVGAAVEREGAGARIALHRTEYPDRDLSILDILPAGCGKGAALTEMAQGMGISIEEMMAIGDNWNDVSMLETAGRAVLMANAPEDLQAIAQARGWKIGQKNTDDGVAVAIEGVLEEMGRGVLAVR